MENQQHFADFPQHIATVTRTCAYYTTVSVCRICFAAKYCANRNIENMSFSHIFRPNRFTNTGTDHMCRLDTKHSFMYSCSTNTHTHSLVCSQIPSRCVDRKRNLKKKIVERDLNNTKKIRESHCEQRVSVLLCWFLKKERERRNWSTKRLKHIKTN